MPARILALDQGTTGSGAFTFDEKLRIKGHRDKGSTQHFPKPGWVAHDAEEIWQTTLAVARNALRKAKSKPADVAAIGITPAARPRR